MGQRIPESSNYLLRSAQAGLLDVKQRSSPLRDDARTRPYPRIRTERSFEWIHEKSAGDF
jgi:hypothetical protein